MTPPSTAGGPGAQRHSASLVYDSVRESKDETQLRPCSAEDHQGHPLGAQETPDSSWPY